MGPATELSDNGASCLLVSYAEIGVNSTNHVLEFARGLNARGWKVWVSALDLRGAKSSFRFFRCSHLGTEEVGLADVEAPQIVHVWTPRGAIWNFLAEYPQLLAGRLILHLEDDEDEVLKAYGRSISDRNGFIASDVLERSKLGHLSHPILTRVLANAADGVTALNPSLTAIVPSGRPTASILPPLDTHRLAHACQSLGENGEQVVVYSGALHPAIAEDFYALCRAVRILTQRGRRLKLVRCGALPHPERILKRGATLARSFEDRGFLNEEELWQLLRGATVLVQPGVPNAFNKGRFPAKLPSYLASRTPVVMPACYRWLGVEHRRHAVLLQSGTAEEIADGIEWIIDNANEASAMGQCAAEFARQRFDRAKCCGELDTFYRAVLARPRGIGWEHLTRPKVQLPRWVAASMDVRPSVPREALLRFASEELRRAGRASNPQGFASGRGPLVSVVVPNFNHLRFLRERLDSIFNQTYRNLEVLILDDASEDGSREFLENLQCPFPLRLIFNEKNSGSVFRQWNRGVIEAKGAFVWIAESDDSCRPEFVERVLSAAIWDLRVGLAYAQSTMIDEEGREMGSLLSHTDPVDNKHWRSDYLTSGEDEVSKYLVVRNTIPNVSACLFRREALMEAELDRSPLHTCGDWLAYVKILRHRRLAFVAEHLNFYRRHPSSQTQRAATTGVPLTEMYSVQSYIAENFQVSASQRERAAWFTFQQVNHVLKDPLVRHSMIEDSDLLRHACRFDPRFRERLARHIGRASQLDVLSGKGENLSRRFSFHLWKWTKLEVTSSENPVVLRPLDSCGLVAFRNFKIREHRSGAVIPAAAAPISYRGIEIEGDAFRVSSIPNLEIYVTGSGSRIKIPNTGSAQQFSLEFEARIAALNDYEGAIKKQSVCRQGILLLLPHLELGGADRFNLDLIEQLSQRLGWEVTIVTTRRSMDVWAEKFFHLTSDVFMLHRFLPAGAYQEFISYLIESRRPDVVLLSHSELGYRWLPWLKHAFPRLPIIDLVHIVMEDWKNGGYPRMSCESRVWLDRTIAISNDLKGWLVQKGCSPESVDVVHCNVNVETWKRSPDLTSSARERWKLPNKRPILLYSARFAPQKQPEILPVILRLLESKGIEVLLVIAGSGPLSAWVEEHVCAAFPRTVKLLGPLDSDGMRQILAATDVLILPSRAEGIALALYEAMSMSVVPIATDVGGQRELVTPDCGILLPVGDDLAERMADEIAALLSDPVRRARMGAAGRKRVETEFPLSKMGERMNEIFGRYCTDGSPEKWTPRPVPPDMADKLAADLREVQADEVASDAWERSVRSGKWLPRATSGLAEILRRSPLRHWFRRFESDYGEKIGRWMVRRD